VNDVIINADERTIMDEHTFLISDTMRNNYLGLFEELLSMKDDDQAVLFAWFMDNLFLIEQSVDELQFLQSEEEFSYIDINNLPDSAIGE
jgi:hypothetical protein